MITTHPMGHNPVRHTRLDPQTLPRRENGLGSKLSTNYSLMCVCVCHLIDCSCSGCHNSLPSEVKLEALSVDTP